MTQAEKHTLESLIAELSVAVQLEQAQVARMNEAVTRRNDAQHAITAFMATPSDDAPASKVRKPRSDKGSVRKLGMPSAEAKV